MIDMRLQPPYLPQITLPYDVLVDKLQKDGIICGYEKIDPNELEPTQGITFSDFMTNDIDSDDKFIWVSKDNKIIDGHHKWNKALNLSKPYVNIVKLDLNTIDAARVINKIQDIFEYEEKLDYEQNDLKNKEHIKLDFLGELESQNETRSPQKVRAYRKNEINEKSIVGNFFILQPTDGYVAYDIEFENLLDVQSLGVKLLDSQCPIDMLVKVWFPSVNFVEKSNEYNTTQQKLKTKAIAEKAKKLGYDGIRYNDKLLHGLK